jgi:preprotein translocase subunit SecF
MTYRFRNLRFGMAALVALLHDVIVTVGFFAIAGTVAGIEIDALFVTAMLTIIGFSVHDTIVVFDRVRENLVRHAGAPFGDIVNHSIVQTLGRSFNTTATVLITLLTLLVFAGGSIRTFVLTLFVGILSGTYSSIFNASPLLVWWEERAQARKAAAARTRTA